jgi:hypothetical protein
MFAHTVLVAGLVKPLFITECFPTHTLGNMPRPWFQLLLLLSLHVHDGQHHCTLLHLTLCQIHNSGIHALARRTIVIEIHGLTRWKHRKHIL